MGDGPHRKDAVVPVERPRKGDNAEGMPPGMLVVPETPGQNIGETLNPIKSKLRTARQLDQLGAWLNANQDSPMAIAIKEGELFCFGRPDGELAPFLDWDGDRFDRGDGWLDYGWGPHCRAVL